MNPLILATAIALTSNFNATVTTAGEEASVGGALDAEQHITLPTNKYHCTRLAVSRSEKSVAIMMGCADSADKPLFVIGALCRTDVPDNDLAVIVLNVAPDGEKPRPVQIALSCKTYREGYSL